MCRIRPVQVCFADMAEISDKLNPLMISHIERTSSFSAIGGANQTIPFISGALLNMPQPKIAISTPVSIKTIASSPHTDRNRGTSFDLNNKE